jgi:hypothetical protein
MKKNLYLVLSLLLIGLPFICFGLSSDEGEEKKNGLTFPVEEYGQSWMKSDRDEDGNTDYAVQLDRKGNLKKEVMDFNYDGYMDDFYFFEEGKLVREEIDSNFDNKIDIWVYVTDNVYIERYERDTDFDGEIDEVTDFTE